MSWKLWLLTSLTSLITAVTAVIVLQFVLLNLGISEAITNPIALIAGISAIFLSEWQIRRWWTRRQ
jgi:hypothetical protein